MTTSKSVTLPLDVLPEPAILRGWSAAACGINKFGWARCFDDLADAIEGQHPPKMEEPEFGEKVTASSHLNPRRRTFVRFRADGAWAWTDGDNDFNWVGLVDPQPYNCTSDSSACKAAG